MGKDFVILSIETSTDACSAALVQGAEVLSSRLQKSGSEHAKDLPLMIDELLKHTPGLTLDAVAVSEGPGSYTGLRIGASVAKGLAYGLNIPLLAVPTLQLMAAQVARELKKKGEKGLLCPMIDARRMEVYNAFYTLDLEEVSPVRATVVDEHSFAEQLAAGNVFFFGNGAAKCVEILPKTNAVLIEGIVPDAAWAGHVQNTPVDLAYWTPFYLKDYEAKKVSGLTFGTRSKE